MARITVEDCLEKVDNQYDLVLLAKERTVQLNAGAPMLVEEDNDKRTIISLREIGDGKLDVKEVEASAIKRLRKEPDESEEQEENWWTTCLKNMRRQGLIDLNHNIISSMASYLDKKEDLIKVALAYGIQYLPSPDMTETPLQFANDIKNKDSINIILEYLSSVSNTYYRVDK